MAVSSPQSTKKAYTEVYIWFSQREDGTKTTAWGALGKSKGRARIGHAAMSVFTNSGKEHYMSFWPSGTAKKVPKYGLLMPNLLADELSESGTWNSAKKRATHRSKPDVIVRLHFLKIPEMLRLYNAAQKKTEQKKLIWSHDCSCNDKISLQKTRSASCTSFVYNILRAGGIESDVYGSNVKAAKRNHMKYVPKDFYRATRCHTPAIGTTPRFIDKPFSPKSLLLRVVAAASGYCEDKKATMEIMKSDRVDTNPRGTLIPWSPPDEEAERAGPPEGRVAARAVAPGNSSRAVGRKKPEQSSGFNHYLTGLALLVSVISVGVLLAKRMKKN